jgi:hypothetical protein
MPEIIVEEVVVEKSPGWDFVFDLKRKQVVVEKINGFPFHEKFPDNDKACFIILVDGEMDIARVHSDTKGLKWKVSSTHELVSEEAVAGWLQIID